MKKESPNSRKPHKVFFFFNNFSLFLQKKEILLRFLYAFGFCNQSKSLAPTLKILLVFLFETAANQLQQSKDCCKVSYVLGSCKEVSHKLEIYATNERSLLQDQVQLGIEVKIQL